MNKNQNIEKAAGVSSSTFLAFIIIIINFI